MINNEPGSDEVLRRIEAHKGARFISPLVRFEAVASLARLRSGARKPTPEQFDAAGIVINDFVEMPEASDMTITPPSVSRRWLPPAPMASMSVTRLI